MNLFPNVLKMTEDQEEEIIYAIETGRVANVRAFLEEHSYLDLDAEMHYSSETPLMTAIRARKTKVFDFLLNECGVCVKGGGFSVFQTPLQFACGHHALVDSFVKSLIDRGADVNQQGCGPRSIPNTPLWHAAGQKKIKVVKMLLDAGADVNLQGCEVPLHAAASQGHPELIDLFLQAGANVNAVTTFDEEGDGEDLMGNTPLHFLASCTDPDNILVCLKKLLDAGVDVHARNVDGQTALHCAAVREGPRADRISINFGVFGVDAFLVTILIQAGCDPLQKDNVGRTPLQSAWYKSQNDIRRLNEREEEGEDERVGLRALLYVRFREAYLSHSVIVALVAAGDRSWECVPTPCPGLEAAMLSVWKNAPDEFPELVKRLENPPQSMSELFPRLPQEIKEAVLEVLRGVNKYSYLKENVLNSVFGF